MRNLYRENTQFYGVLLEVTYSDRTAVREPVIIPSLTVGVQLKGLGQVAVQLNHRSAVGAQPSGQRIVGQWPQGIVRPACVVAGMDVVVPAR